MSADTFIFVCEGMVFNQTKKETGNRRAISLSLEDFSRYVFGVPYATIQEALQRKDVMNRE